MATKLPTQQYRIRLAGPHDGATCFLTPSQALGFGLPDRVPAYAPGRATVPIEVPADAVLGFEPV